MALADRICLHLNLVWQGESSRSTRLDSTQLSNYIVNAPGPQTGIEHTLRPTDATLMTGDTVQRWFTVALTKDDDSGAKKTGQVVQERGSVPGISSRQKCRVEPEYFHILLNECVWWDDEAVKLVLVWYETWIQKENGCIFFFRLIRTTGVKMFLFLHHVSFSFF